ncbi:hypothetical protein FOMPIDRAFT_1023622 [Fomitopsis schrenkii]|uniref:Coatomer subunit epsilon n=1 Tax=Fomitopsis schrenkii TaxID=2126942 RepID=S8EBK2_FOMSC|nr:hypothetical protein FOMPIDRAFT_1023622 [Fomitopsis schrenkii]
MDSSELFYVKQQFLLGAYKSLVDLALPDPNSPDYTPTLVYKARAYIALDDPKPVQSLIPADAEDVSLKAVSALARYVGASSPEDKEASLEELRDLCVEIEGEDVDATPKERGTVRVLAGTAFALANEVEEALETLGVGSNTDNLEAVALTVQIYLSINRPDLARKEFERAKRWAGDDMLVQLVEAFIGMVTGKDGYQDCNSFYDEQLGNPSLTSPHLLTARGITRLLRGEVAGAKSDFEEAVLQHGGKPDAETLGAMTVAAGLTQSKSNEAEQLWSQFIAQHPSHPMIVDLARKSEQFDELSMKFTVPPLATAA